MGEVPRDLAQFCSGRRDVPWGGIAYLNGLCNSRSYSAIGYVNGFFVDPSIPHVYNHDIAVAAHEIGHNCGTPHTHDLDLDTCNDETTPPQRGTIMSYCGQTFTGGSANTDLGFHTVVRAVMLEYASGRDCVTFDCNANGIDDDDDIADGTSLDVNGNGVPDECEDCNDNGVLDPVDIAGGTSDDDNGNGVPDECEADCNGNGVPDDVDLATISEDLNFNGIPDECEADCNDNGVSDYTEIQLDMTLDIDRNAVLDSCQDCDLDGIPDIVALDGANSIWAISSGDATLREYHPLTGVLMRTAEAGHLADPQDVLITGDARILVSSAGDDDHVAEFDRTGTFVRTLVASGAGGLDDPGAMLATKDGRLLVAGRASSNVLAYDLGTGVFMGELVSPDEANPVGPYGLALAPNGHLLVGTADHKVLEYDSKTGELIRELVPAQGGGLLSPRDLLVLSDHRLLVASEDLGHILAYDADSGRFLGQFDYGQFGDGLAGAWGLAMAGDGYVYVTSSEQPEQFHLTDPRMLMYDTDNGWLIRTIVQRPDSQLAHPHGVDFMPGDGDCNRNLLPDACDIASGASADANGNEVPDECENLCPADINGDGALNVLDFVAFQLAWQDHDPSADCNDDGSFDITDFVCYQVLYQAGCD
jgi:outer membrane protein assembly factor BamB